MLRDGASGVVEMTKPGSANRYRVKYRSESGEDVWKYTNDRPGDGKGDPLKVKEIQVEQFFKDPAVLRLIGVVEGGGAESVSDALGTFGKADGWSKLKRLCRMMLEAREGEKEREAKWKSALEWVNDNARKYRRTAGDISAVRGSGSKLSVCCNELIRVAGFLLGYDRMS